MVCEKYGGAGELSWALEECLINSSNEAYELLRDTYGLDVFGDWLEGVGATEASEQAREYGYPDISAGELAEVWEEIFRYGTSGEDGSDELVGALSATNYTALGELLRDEFEVWAKPGWYPTDEYDLTSTNDAGVVFSDCGPYVIVVMTSMNSDLYGLLPLVDALNAAHGRCAEAAPSCSTTRPWRSRATSAHRREDRCFSRRIASARKTGLRS